MYAIWIAYGAQYIQEAVVAAKSLKAQMPDVTTCLFTRGSFEEGFDRVGTVSSRRGSWYTTLVRWCHESLRFIPDGAKCLYFDTDVYIISPIYDIFDLLDKYDIVGTHAPARLTQPLAPMPINIPLAFPEINVGVIGFRNNGKIKSLFKDWMDKHSSNHYGNNDQRSLRAALWEGEANLYVMPPEYNFRFGFGGFAGKQVKVLHGRSEDMEALAEKVVTERGMTTWKRGELK